MTESLFDKYGGFTVFTQIVSRFYQKILNDDELAPYFEKVDISAVMSHQTNFIAAALGGPNNTRNYDLKKVHAPYKITKAHFLTTMILFEEALREADVSIEDTKQIISLIAVLMNEIISIN